MSDTRTRFSWALLDWAQQPYYTLIGSVIFRPYFVAAVAVSRLYLGVHWLTDVLAGVLLASAVVAAGATALHGTIRRQDAETPHNIMDFWQIVIHVMLLFAVAIGVGAFQLPGITEGGVFKERGDGVETEACNSSVEPEADGVKHRFFYGRIMPVQIGLFSVETVVVVLACLGVVLP